MTKPQAAARLSIQLGALAPPLYQQLRPLLAAQYLSDAQVSHFQRDADAISRLVVRSLLTKREAKMARDRLVKSIMNSREGN